MNTYYTKCGRSFKKSAKADTTGYHIAEQLTGGPKPGHIVDPECVGCPFVVDVKDGWPEQQHKRYECRAGCKPPSHENEWIGRLDDKCTIQVHSLDHDFCERIITFCGKHPDLFANYNQDRADCRRTVSIGCSQNKKGIVAKKEIINKFFNTDASSLDPTDDPDDLAASLTEEENTVPKFHHKFDPDEIMDSAKEVADQADGLEPVPEQKEIRCSLVDFNPDNVFANKDTDETIEELAGDIEANGLLHAIVVNHIDGRYRLISGERRFRAITMLHWQVVQANVYEGLSKFGELKRLYAANFQVRQYTAAEALTHYMRLVDILTEQQGKPLSTRLKDEIAKMLNISRRQVNKYTRICDDLTKDEQQAVAENRMSINKANDLAKKRAQKVREPVPQSSSEQINNREENSQEPNFKSAPSLPPLNKSAKQEPVPENKPKQPASGKISLLSCPHCKGEAEYRQFANPKNFYSVICTVCGCGTDGFKLCRNENTAAQNKEINAIVWNRRA